MKSRRKKWMLPLVMVYVCIIILLACKKQDEWLDVRRQNRDVVPTTLKDIQALLDNTTVMNKNYPQTSLLGTDNHLITDVNLTAAAQNQRNAYLWEKELFPMGTSIDWTYPYQIISYANIALGGLEELEKKDGVSQEIQNLRGTAMFYRSNAYYQLLQIFSKTYDEVDAITDLGVPIRTTQDISLRSERASIQKCYERMILDLLFAAEVLPEAPLYKTRPSRVAARGLLSKIYLLMHDYENALKYSDLALKEYGTLIDFKAGNVSTTLTYRFPTFAQAIPEIIFYAEAANIISLSAFASGSGQVAPELYGSYAGDDLRRTVFFQDYGNGRIKFQGTYTGNQSNFAGIATNELYLIRAESNARLGNAESAIDDLNLLLVNRYRQSYVPIVGNSADHALSLILIERRKELPYTGQVRWEDLRRLNQYPAFQKLLQRTYLGKTYQLLPNDKRYVFPIPDIEIQFYGMEQNLR